jgi:hypothetical protein
MRGGDNSKRNVTPDRENAMGRRLRLICYGHEDMLLFTRKCILEREFSVELCRGLIQLDELLAQGPVHVIVMCHSVPDSECEEAMGLARAAWPEVKILTLREGDHGECPLHSDRTMESLDGPPMLLSKVHSMLGMASTEGALVGDRIADGYRTSGNANAPVSAK